MIIEPVQIIPTLTVFLYAKTLYALAVHRLRTLENYIEQ